MTSKEYQDATREISNMESALKAVITQANVVEKCMNKIKCDDELSILLVDIGRIMDKHAKDMADL